MKYFLLLAFFAPVLASAATETCPPELEVRTDATTPPGWQLVTGPANNVLDRVGFYSGPPAEGASLVPDKTQSKNGEARDTWTFVPNAVEVIWLACFYHGTTLALAKPVVAGATRCDVRYKTTRTGARLNVTTVQCK